MMSRDLSSRMRPLPRRGSLRGLLDGQERQAKRAIRPVTWSAVRFLQPHTLTAAVLVDELDAHGLIKDAAGLYGPSLDREYGCLHSGG